MTDAMRPRGLRVLFGLPALVLAVLFFFVPLASVIMEAGADGGSAFGRLAADPVFWRGLGGSLVLGTVAPLISVAVGLLVSLHLARLKPGTRTAALFAISLPLTFSGVIIAYGFILAFGRSGFVTQTLALAGADPAFVGGLIFTPAGLGFAYSYYLIPRVVMIMLPVIVNFDHAQVAAARSLGATNARAHWDVLVPQVFPSLVAAFCLCAAVAIGAYGTALALVGTQINILPLVLYSKISDVGTDLPAAAAISVVLMAVCSLVFAAAEVLFQGRRPGR